MLFFGHLSLPRFMHNRGPSIFKNISGMSGSSGGVHCAPSTPGESRPGLTSAPLYAYLPSSVGLLDGDDVGASDRVGTEDGRSVGANEGTDEG